MFDDYVYELPAGWIEKEEEALTAAVRELEEETGFKGKGKIITNIYPQPGFCSMQAQVVLLNFEEETLVQQSLSEDENIKFELKNIDEVKQMISSGEIKDMGFLSAFCLYLISGSRL